MKYLAIDTSGKKLCIVAVNGGKVAYRDRDCAMRHSVVLFPEIDGALEEVGLDAAACDFFACAVGAGSFTGIRIGISAVKGLCVATGKEAVSVTSFEAIAYAERGGKRLALVDAGHDFYYACAFEDDQIAVPPAYVSRARVDELIAAGYQPLSAEPLGVQSRVVSLAKGLHAAVEARCGETIPARELAALYLRKSSAEEKR